MQPWQPPVMRFPTGRHTQPPTSTRATPEGDGRQWARCTGCICKGFARFCCRLELVCVHTRAFNPADPAAHPSPLPFCVSSASATEHLEGLVPRNAVGLNPAAQRPGTHISNSSCCQAEVRGCACGKGWVAWEGLHRCQAAGVQQKCAGEVGVGAGGKGNTRVEARQGSDGERQVSAAGD
jgi:hypothetical protein